LSGWAWVSGAVRPATAAIAPEQHGGLVRGDLVGRLRLLVLVQILHLVAVLDRVLDQLLDVVEVGARTACS